MACCNLKVFWIKIAACRWNPSPISIPFHFINTNDMAAWSEVKGGTFWWGSEGYGGVVTWNEGKVFVTCVRLFMAILRLFSVQRA
jgi:hypothetical protein